MERVDSSKKQKNRSDRIELASKTTKEDCKLRAKE